MTANECRAGLLPAILANVTTVPVKNIHGHGFFGLHLTFPRP